MKIKGSDETIDLPAESDAFLPPGAHVGVSETEGGPYNWGPYNKDPTIWATIFGSWFGVQGLGLRVVGS